MLPISIFFIIFSFISLSLVLIASIPYLFSIIATLHAGPVSADLTLLIFPQIHVPVPVRVSALIVINFMRLLFAYVTIPDTVHFRVLQAISFIILRLEFALTPILLVSPTAAVVAI